MDSLGVRIEVGLTAVEDFVVTCGAPGCEKVPRSGASFCRAHTPIAELRHERDGLAALERMDAGEPQNGTPPVAVGQREKAPARMAEPETEDTKVDTQKAVKPRGYWTRDRIIESLQRWHAEHGKPPGQKDWQRSGDYWPSQTNVAKVFGTWGTAVVAAGYTPGGGGRRPVLAEREPKADETKTSSPDAEPEVSPSAAPVVQAVSPAAGNEPASRSANTDLTALFAELASALENQRAADGRVDEASHAIRQHPDGVRAIEALL